MLLRIFSKKLIAASFVLATISEIFSNEKLPQRVIICGVCKEVADRLPYTINIMEKIGNLFSDYHIIVYENNSSDATPNKLKEWARKNLKVHVTSGFLSDVELAKAIVNRTKDQKFFVPEAIARARNIVLDVAMSEKYQNFDYLIWMDMDFRREPAYDGFKEIFTSTKEWDAVFAYGIAPDEEYWDWFAFRDCQMPIGPEVLGNYWWYLPRKKTGFLNVKDNWYPVYSAFGGCGVYKKSSIQGCRYSALVTSDLAQLLHSIIYKRQPVNESVQKYLNNLKNTQKYITLDKPRGDLPNIDDENIGIITAETPGDIIWRMNSFVYKYPVVCEHVTFHASMIIRGHDKLFINPRLIFRYSS